MNKRGKVFPEGVSMNPVSRDQTGETSSPKAESLESKLFVSRAQSILGSKENVAAKALSIQELLNGFLQEAPVKEDQGRAPIPPEVESEESGPRRFLGILTQPTSHKVIFRWNTPTNDFVFADSLTLAERLGVMGITNTYSAFMHHISGLLVLVKLIASPMFLLNQVSREWELSPGSERALWWIFILPFVLEAAWAFVFVISYSNLGALTKIFRTAPSLVVWMLLSRSIYTSLCVVYFPKDWNVILLVWGLMASLFAVTEDSTHVFFRLRMSKSRYKKLFQWEGPTAAVIMGFKCIDVLHEISRHLTVLSIVAQKQIESGTDNDIILLNEVSVAHLAYSVTVKQWMNATYTVSIWFMVAQVLGFIRHRGFGKRVNALPDRIMLDTKSVGIGIRRQDDS